MNQLPTFNGWTVDARLKEFRKATPNDGITTLGGPSYSEIGAVRYLSRYTSRELHDLITAIAGTKSLPIRECFNYERFRRWRVSWPAV